MKLSSVIFWDTDYSKIDWENKAQFVISRVVNFGSIDDWNEIKKFYGREKIMATMLQERDLDDRALSFLACVLNIPKSEFRCYKERQLHQQPWTS
jgi:hypothetical protein